MVGYVTFVGRKSNGYFDFYIGTQEKEHRIVSFILDIRQVVSSKLNSGVLLSKLSSSGSDFLFDRHSQISDKAPSFTQIMEYEVPITSLNASITAPLFSRISTEFKVVEVQPQGISKDGLPYQPIMVIDNSVSEPRKFTLYDKLVGQMRKGDAFHVSFVSINMCEGVQILKTTERSLITPRLGTNICMPLDQSEAATGKVVNVSISSLKKQKLCPGCQNVLHSTGSLFIITLY